MRQHLVKAFPSDKLPLSYALQKRKAVENIEHGRIQWLSVNAAPLYNHKNTFMGAVASFRDITDQKMVEQELQKEMRFIDAILETSDTLIIVLDTKYRIVRFNQACEKVSSYKEKELSRFDYLADSESTKLTSRSFGQFSFRENDPQKFEELLHRYKDIFADQLDERIHKTDHRISHRLQAVSHILGTLHAGPKDIIQLHTHALKILTQGIAVQKAHAFAEEGRLLALELMGYLVDHYRNKSIFPFPTKKPQSPWTANNTGGEEKR